MSPLCVCGRHIAKVKIYPNTIWEIQTSPHLLWLAEYLSRFTVEVSSEHNTGAVQAVLPPLILLCSHTCFISSHQLLQCLTPVHRQFVVVPLWYLHNLPASRNLLVEEPLLFIFWMPALTPCSSALSSSPATLSLPLSAAPGPHL